MTLLHKLILLIVQNKLDFPQELERAKRKFWVEMFGTKE